MKIKMLVVGVLTVLMSATAFSHSGRTDSQGGHNCSEKSKKKGLCSGYHYHANEAIDLEKPVAKVKLDNKSKAYKVELQNSNEDSDKVAAR